MTTDKRFVAIAGNIGVGKSTLTTLLAERLGWEAFYEAVDDNPYLEDFYNDMESFSFQSQMFFLSRRLHHHRELMDYPYSVVQDRSIYEDAEIFARTLYQQGNMTVRDWNTYREIYDAVRHFLTPPDIVVYLRASVETLQARIARRGRAFEQDIDIDYLRRLNVLYEDWIKRYSLGPVLIVPADDLDFVEHDSHLSLIVAKIQEKLSGKDEVLFLAEDIARVAA